MKKRIRKTGWIVDVMARCNLMGAERDRDDSVSYIDSKGNECVKAESKDDLMMLPEKKEGWAVIRRSNIYETEEQAKEVLLNSRVGVMIRKIEWEE